MKPSQGSSKTARVWMQGWVLVLAFVASLDVLIGLWPAVEAATSSSGSPVTSTTATSVQVRLLFGLLPWKPSTSVALLGLVAVAGVLGSLVHTMDGFALHVADKDFDKAWNWWYLIRPLVGAGLAVPPDRGALDIFEIGGREWRRSSARVQLGGGRKIGNQFRRGI